MTATNHSASHTCGIHAQGTHHDNFGQVHLIILCITNIAFTIAGILLNSFVLCTFVKSRLLRDKPGSFFLVAVLSAVDLLVVAIVHPLAVVYLLSEIRESDVCDYEFLYNILRHLLCSLSSYVLLLMSAERYVAILYPYFYQRSMTIRKMSWSVALLCLVIIGEWLLVVIVKSTKGVVIITQISILFFASGAIYTTIYLIAKKKRRQNTARSRERQHFLKNIKITSLYVLVSLTFTACFLPTLGAYILMYFVKPGNRLYQTYLIFRLWARTFVTMNSTFNCLIFFWKNATLRNEAKMLALKFWPRATFVSSEVSSTLNFVPTPR